MWGIVFFLIDFLLFQKETCFHLKTKLAKNLFTFKHKQWIDIHLFIIQSHGPGPVPKPEPGPEPDTRTQTIDKWQNLLQVEERRSTGELMVLLH